MVSRWTSLSDRWTTHPQLLGFQMGHLLSFSLLYFIIYILSYGISKLWQRAFPPYCISFIVYKKVLQSKSASLMYNISYNSDNVMIANYARNFFLVCISFILHKKYYYLKVRLWFTIFHIILTMLWPSVWIIDMFWLQQSWVALSEWLLFCH